MSVLLTLPDEVVQHLAVEAERRGISIEDLVVGAFHT